ncbi:uncharacterized protein LOC114245550 isoform X2 [Bombyx mandarina]|uniref:Uncharacterized protein LOC114245550 isoform X1 n=1 Tax=Bombyx mandarina TaxID=7092 RepID=A0A6J2JVJ1_BOMMA|nr:uncharacterized protein LOC114245550 isoform X1 [Bombyx mandarina]XP_028033565.1 uncharacterized protein LOC114245550 isoform X2 [Bombyx mandarina]
MPIVTCEICGLRTSRVDNKKRTFMAQFPLDEDRCKQWVKITGKEDLAYVPIEKLHQLKHICGKHFRPKDFKKKRTQLRRNAVPCIEITAEPLSDEILSDFPLHLPKKAVEDQHLQFDATNPSIPQCSKDFFACIVQEHNYCKHNDTERTLPSPSVIMGRKGPAA